MGMSFETAENSRRSSSNEELHNQVRAWQMRSTVHRVVPIDAARRLFPSRLLEAQSSPLRQFDSLQAFPLSIPLLRNFFCFFFLSSSLHICLICRGKVSIYQSRCVGALVANVLFLFFKAYVDSRYDQASFSFDQVESMS